MEEKILIKSQIDKKAKNVMIGIVTTFFAIAAIIFLFLSGKEESYYGSIYARYWHAFHGNGLYLSLLIIACISLIFGIISLIMFFIHNKCELIITEKNAKGRAIFGKEVVLPIYKISAYSTKSFMSTISVSSSSGIAKFSFVENYAEIGNVLSQLINKRQDQTQAVANDPKTTSSNIDDLMKLKVLLEQGIITQEEFDAKKKQLLDL